jgi:hypothetical protein
MAASRAQLDLIFATSYAALPGVATFISSGDMKAFRKFLRRMPFYSAYKSLFHYPDYWYWRLRPHPKRSPHLVKQRALLEYANKYSLRTLVETGTYYGEMVAALKNQFDSVVSVESLPELARAAARKFKPYPNVRIYDGESQNVIPEILASLTAPALFWLDAGYYTWDGLDRNKQRLAMELEAILGEGTTGPERLARGHIVLIDDASTLKFRTGSNPEPRDIAELEANLAAAFPARHIEIRNDIVRITPRG